MADEKREQVMAAVIDRMKTIRTANGYLTDIGKNVFRWRMTPLNEGEVPGMSVRDPRRTVLRRYSDSLRDYQLTVEMEAVSAPGSLTDSDLNNTLQDLYRAFLEVDPTFGGLVFSAEPDSDEKTFDHQAQKFGSAICRFNLTYRS